jgi:hypothetical protein
MGALVVLRGQPVEIVAVETDPAGSVTMGLQRAAAQPAPPVPALTYSAMLHGMRTGTARLGLRTLQRLP